MYDVRYFASTGEVVIIADRDKKGNKFESHRDARVYLLGRAIELKSRFGITGLFAHNTTTDRFFERLAARAKKP